MLAYAADRGPVDHGSSGPGASGKSSLKAPAQFGAKKDIHILHCCLIKQNGWYFIMLRSSGCNRYPF